MISSVYSRLDNAHDVAYNDVMSDCILSYENLASNGYARRFIEGKLKKLHRIALEQKIGRPIRTGYCACHTCDVRNCVNEDHLGEGTPGDNARDRNAKGRQSCGQAAINGSKLTEQDVRSIRAALVNAPRGTASVLTLLYGVSLLTIYRVRDRKTWAHVT